MSEKERERNMGSISSLLEAHLFGQSHSMKKPATFPTFPYTSCRPGALEVASLCDPNEMKYYI